MHNDVNDGIFLKMDRIENPPLFKRIIPNLMGKPAELITSILPKNQERGNTSSWDDDVREAVENIEIRFQERSKEIGKILSGSNPDLERRRMRGTIPEKSTDQAPTARLSGEDILQPDETTHTPTFGQLLEGVALRINHPLALNQEKNRTSLDRIKANEIEAKKRMQEYAENGSFDTPIGTQRKRTEEVTNPCQQPETVSDGEYALAMHEFYGRDIWSPNGELR